MSDQVPVYIFVADEPVQVGTVNLESDGTITGFVGENVYKTLAASDKPWFFAILPQR